MSNADGRSPDDLSRPTQLRSPGRDETTRYPWKTGLWTLRGRFLETGRDLAKWTALPQAMLWVVKPTLTGNSTLRIPRSAKEFLVPTPRRGAVETAGH